MDKDIRRKQRFLNYEKALPTLQNAVELSSARALTVLERQGMIRGFELTCNVMKDYLVRLCPTRSMCRSVTNCRTPDLIEHIGRVGKTLYSRGD